MECKIKEMRISKNMSQTKLAELASISRETISNLERGKQMNITKKTMISIARALDTEVFNIFLL